MEKIYSHIFKAAKAGGIIGAAIGGLGGGASSAISSKDAGMSFMVAAVGGISAGVVGTLIGAGCGLVTGIIETAQDNKRHKNAQTTLSLNETDTKKAKKIKEVTI